MTRPPFYTAIDVGTTKVCVLVGSVGPSGLAEVVGMGFELSRGLRKGTVVNIPEARAVIERAAAEAQRQADVRIRQAIVGVTGSHILSQNVLTRWQCRDARHPVNSRDLEDILSETIAIPLDTAQRLLHAIPRSYSLDGQRGVRNPVGMYTRLMEVENHLITAARAPVENLVQAVEGAGVGVEGLVLEPLASSEAVMTADEREIGAVLVDIGGGTSDIAVFKNGTIWHTGVIPVGGYQLTNDLSIGLGVPYAAAEEVKVQHGHVLPDHIGEEEVITVPRLGSSETQQVHRRQVAEILHDRCQELVRMVLHHIARSELDHFPPAGVVLTGGSALLPGLETLAASAIPGPVRVGVPRGLVGSNDVLEHPKFATAAGTLLWNIRHHGWKPRGRNGSTPLLRRLVRQVLPYRRRFSQQTLREPLATQRR